MRQKLRALLPASARRFSGQIVAARRARRLGRLSRPQAVGEIYRKAYWKQGQALSGAGSEGRWADDDCAVTLSLLDRRGSAATG